MSSRLQREAWTYCATAAALPCKSYMGNEKTPPKMLLRKRNLTIFSSILQFLSIRYNLQNILAQQCTQNTSNCSNTHCRHGVWPNRAKPGADSSSAVCLQEESHSPLVPPNPGIGEHRPIFQQHTGKPDLGKSKSPSGWWQGSCRAFAFAVLMQRTQQACLPGACLPSDMAYRHQNTSWGSVSRWR